MTEEEIAAFIDRSLWRFASSMPHIPHEYTLRKHAASEEEFERFVLWIREAGEIRPWGKHRHHYLDVGPHSYWTMGHAVEITTVINREIKGVNDEIGRRIARRMK